MDTSKPVAYMRKWYFDGEVPNKEKKENGRWVWPKKFQFLAVTPIKIFKDDIPLWVKPDGEGKHGH